MALPGTALAHQLGIIGVGMVADVGLQRGPGAVLEADIPTLRAARERGARLLGEFFLQGHDPAVQHLKQLDGEPGVFLDGFAEIEPVQVKNLGVADGHSE